MQRNAQPGLDPNGYRTDRRTGAPARGVSLNRLLELQPFSDAQAVAVGVALLEELVSLEAAGRDHGALSTRSVRVLDSGAVEIAGPPRPGAGGDGADVRAAGQVVCSALGVGVEHSDERAGGLEPASRVVVTARAMAQGALGRRAATALGLFVQGVGRLGHPAQVVASLDEVGALSRRLQNAPAGAREAAGRAPLPPPVLVPPLPSDGGKTESKTASEITRLARATASVEPRPKGRVEPIFGFGMTAGAAQGPTAGPGLPVRWRVLLQSVLVAALVFLVLAQVFHLGVSPDHRAAPPQPAAPAREASIPAPSQPAAATPIPAPQPQPVPVFAPPSGARINRVDAVPAAPCAGGADCRLNFTVLMAPSRTTTPIAWTVNVFDRCTGAVDTFPGGRFVAPVGWTRVELTTLLPLPARSGPQSLVVVSSAPDAVASPPLQVGAPAC